MSQPTATTWATVPTSTVTAGAASGTVPTTIDAMADDAVTLVRGLGYDRVDLFGFSMGGMVATSCDRR